MSQKIHERPNETCSRHRCSRSHLYKLAGQGKIIMRKLGRSTLVDIASADAYFSTLPLAKIKSSSRTDRQIPVALAANVAVTEPPRRRGRPRKLTPTQTTAPPVQPQDVPPSTHAGESA